MTGAWQPPPGCACHVLCPGLDGQAIPACVLAELFMLGRSHGKFYVRELLSLHIPAAHHSGRLKPSSAAALLRNQRAAKCPLVVSSH